MKKAAAALCAVFTAISLLGASAEAAGPTSGAAGADARQDLEIFANYERKMTNGILILMDGQPGTLEDGTEIAALAEAEADRELYLSALPVCEDDALEWLASRTGFPKEELYSLYVSFYRGTDEGKLSGAVEIAMRPGAESGEAELWRVDPDGNVSRIEYRIEDGKLVFSAAGEGFYILRTETREEDTRPPAGEENDGTQAGDGQAGETQTSGGQTNGDQTGGVRTGDGRSGLAVAGAAAAVSGAAAYAGYRRKKKAAKEL